MFPAADSDGGSSESGMPVFNGFPALLHFLCQIDMSNRKITVPLSTAGIDRLFRGIKDYDAWIKRKVAEFAERLAKYGLGYAQIRLGTAIYDGVRNSKVSIEERGENKYAIVANGDDILFIEFGAGVKYGYGHPLASKVKPEMGPGTYPDGKGYWNDPNGWWIPKEKGGGHTYGNPPNAPMYNTAQDLRAAVERIAQDVFGRD